MLTSLRVALQVAAHCDLCWPLVTQAWLVLLQLGDLRGWGGLGQLLLEVVSRKAGVIDAEVITARLPEAGHHAIEAWRCKADFEWAAWALDYLPASQLHDIGLPCACCPVHVAQSLLGHVHTCTAPALMLRGQVAWT